MYLVCNGFSLISTCSTYSLLIALAYYQHGVVSRNHIMGVVQTLVFLMQPAVTISWGHVSDASHSIHTHDLWTYFKGKYWYQDTDMGYHNIPRYQYYCPTLALRPCRMCEANWNHVAFLVVLQTTISMELEFNLSQYSISSQCLHIDHEKSALENISAMPQLFSPVANFPQQYSTNWYSPSCVGRIKSTLSKFLGPTETCEHKSDPLTMRCCSV